MAAPRTARRSPAALARCLATGALAAGLAGCTDTPRSLDIATTTTVRGTGILDAVLPSFSAATVHVHATSSGRALAMLQDHIVDVVISHAPDAEARYLAEHPDWAYQKFAYNRFILVGPAEDPAGVRAAPDVVEAFRRIAASPMAFISRGDESGTHERERALWRAAAVTPDTGHLVASGEGMATALVHTHQRQGYTLSDDATFRQMQDKLDLVPLFTDDPRLLNAYALVYSRDNALARAFAAWLASGEGRARAGAFQIGGAPVVTLWPDGCPADKPEARPCS